MADRVFCIDLGSAFTKVAIRTNPTAASRLLSPPAVTSAVGFCVPTAVAAERRADGRQHHDFGSTAADRVSAGNIRVYRNWKKSLFLRPQADVTQHSPLEAMLTSAELADLATRFGVEHNQVVCLRQMVVAARGVTGAPARAISPESQEHKNATILAAHFFKWLREQILAACERLPTTGLKYETIPARLAVPAFAHGRGLETHPGCQAMLEAARRGGWTLHPELPLVTEPYSNAIGVLTRAKNCLCKTGTVNLGDMFVHGPLITVLGEPKTHPTYRALVIDVGAFTTDFARIDLDTKGQTVTDPDSAFEFSQNSVNVGVSDLDSQVIATLPVEKGTWFRNAPGAEQEKFRQNLYAANKPHSTNVVGRIGVGAEGEAIREVVQEFGRRLAGAVTEFCDGREPAFVQELILTGGGAAIPTVRDALQQSAQHGGNKYVHTYAHKPRKVAGAPPITSLDDEMTRGGSALGGTSIYFERSFSLASRDA